MQYHQEDIALGSTVQISIVTKGDEAEVQKLFRSLWKKILTFERNFSRFLPGSELSMFNRNAGLKQKISSEFHDILSAAQKVGLETDGLYNPFILPALQAAGYDHSLVKGHEHDPQDDHSHKSVVGVDRLEIENDWARIPYGTALDLGGCGKGYLADQLADYIEDKVQGYWLALGGDVVCGGVSGNSRPWEVAIQKADILDASRNIGRVQLPSGRRLAIATSGTTVRRGSKQGRPWHHLIDPRSLSPATTDVQLATVCDSSAVKADVLASCAVILGSDDGAVYLKQHGVQAFLLQCETEAGQKSIAHSGNVIHVDESNERTL